LTRILLWLISVAALGWLVQAIILLAGWRYGVFTADGRWILIVLALGVLSLLIAQDRSSAAQYGFVFDARWRRTVLVGFLIGCGVYITCSVATLLGGIMTIRPDIAPAEWTKGLLNGLTAIVVAPITQILFCGYILGMLRTRHGRITSIAVVSILFAFTQRPEAPLSMLTADLLSNFTGLLLAMILLCLLRLRTGSIVFGSSILVGWVFLKRFARFARLFQPNPDAPEWLTRCFFPNGSYAALRGPLVWTVLVIAIVACGAALYRRGERSPSSDASVSFKHLFPFGSPFLLAPLDVWLARLSHARFSVGRLYVPRLVCTLVFSLVATLVVLPERLLLAILPSGRTIRDPIFILGVHRSGTTHLQNLLSLDDSLVTPRLYQVMNPKGFNFLGWLLAPLIACMPTRRPMDNMGVHILAPAEEEYAVANASGLSPYWSQVFPSQREHYDRFIYLTEVTSAELSRWRRCYVAFLRRLTLFTKRRALLKSPYNTARVALLGEMFPTARFIHIRRNPYDVYRSSRRMDVHLSAVTQLQAPAESEPFDSRFLRHYRDIEDACAEGIAGLNAEQSVEVSFEDLEDDPIGQIERIYAQLDLPLSDGFRRRLVRYVQSVADYQKTVFAPLDPESAGAISTQLADLFQRGGYNAQDDSRVVGG